MVNNIKGLTCTHRITHEWSADDAHYQSLRFEVFDQAFGV